MDTITTTGWVGTIPKRVLTVEGLAITTFRLASSQRKFNSEIKQWENGPTNWYTVTAFRQLALNAAASVHKGDRVIVSGRVRVRDWEGDQKSGTVMDIAADSIGHDLAWGTAIFTRTLRSAKVEVSEGANPVASASFDPDEQAAQAVDAGGWALPGASVSEATA